MGEGVAEATVTKWILEVGDTIRIDDPIVEIATDKVDTDVTSEVEGVLVEKCFQENEVVQVGETLLIIETEGPDSHPTQEPEVLEEIVEDKTQAIEEQKEAPTAQATGAVLEEKMEQAASLAKTDIPETTRFYSPLVRNIAKEEGISLAELEAIPGSGKEQRITKKDILAYLENRTRPLTDTTAVPESKPQPSPTSSTPRHGSDLFREMTRMEGLISDHMMSSLKTSAHVQSFIEVDVSRLWDWREKVKEGFLARENEKLTFTPLFMSAIIKALRDYPALNSSIEGTKIITKQAINLGMATALPDGNLIVPVIKNADHLNLVGLAKAVNDLANRARKGQLNPEEVKEGTYTFTNI